MARPGYRIEQVLPHAAPMILLDEIVDYTHDGLTAAVTIREDSRFIQAEGVPAYVGIEYMAQAIAAYGGVESLDRHEQLRIGFLLGTRKFDAYVPFFRVGECLSVMVRPLYKEELASFACRISIAGELVAEANVNVYQPLETPNYEASAIDATSSPQREGKGCDT